MEPVVELTPSQIEQRVLDQISQLDAATFEVPESFDPKWSRWEAKQALEAILSPQPPQVLAWGEKHPFQGYQKGYKGRTHRDLFFSEMLPTLLDRGYRDIVLENVPADFRDLRGGEPGVAVFLDRLKRFNKNTALIADDIQKTLAQCQKLGVTPHGGGMTSEEYDEFLSHQALTAEIVHETLITTRKRSDAAIRRIAKEGRRVLFFGGAFHVDPFEGLHYSKRYTEAPFAPDLVKAGFDYTGVSIVTPSYEAFIVDHLLLETLDFHLAQALWYLNKRDFIPPDGQVTLLKVETSKTRMFYLVYPFE